MTDIHTNKENDGIATNASLSSSVGLKDQARTPSKQAKSTPKNPIESFFTSQPKTNQNGLKSTPNKNKKKTVTSATKSNGKKSISNTSSSGGTPITKFFNRSPKKKVPNQNSVQPPSSSDTQTSNQSIQPPALTLDANKKDGNSGPELKEEQSSNDVKMEDDDDVEMKSAEDASSTTPTNASKQEVDAPESTPAVVAPMNQSNPTTPFRSVDTDVIVIDGSLTPAPNPKPESTAANTSTKRRTSRKKKDPIPPLPEKWQKLQAEYVEKIRQMYKEFPERFDTNQLLSNIDTQSELKQFQMDLKQTIDKNGDSFDLDAYTSLIAKLVQERDDPLSQLTSFVQNTLKTNCIESTGDAMEVDATESSSSSSSSKLDAYLSADHVRAAILKSAERRTYGIKLKSKSTEEVVELDSNGMPVSYEQSRVHVWEALKPEDIPPDLTDTLKSLATDRAAVSRHIRLFDTFTHKYNVLNTRHLAMSEKESQLQHCLDKLIQQETKMKLQQETARKKQLEREEKQRQKELKKLEAERIKQEKKAEAERIKQEKKAEAERLKQEKQAKKEAQDELSPKSGKKEASEPTQSTPEEKVSKKQQAMFKGFFKPKKKEDDDVEMSNTGSTSPTNAAATTNLTQSESPVNRPWKAFKKSADAQYAPIHRASEITEQYSVEQLVNSHPSVEDLRQRMSKRMKKARTIPTPCALPRLGQRKPSVGLSNLIAKMDVDDGGKVDFFAQAAQQASSSAADPSAPEPFLCWSLRQFYEDHRPPFFGVEKRQSNMIKGRLKSFLKQDPWIGIDYEAEDSGVEWFSDDQDSEGEDIEGDDMDEDEDGDEMGKTRTDGWLDDGWLVAQDDAEFGDADIVANLEARKRARNLQKSEYPFHSQTMRRKGDAIDAPITLEIPSISKLQNSPDPRFQKYLQLLTTKATYLHISDYVEHTEADNEIKIEPDPVPAPKTSSSSKTTASSSTSTDADDGKKKEESGDKEKKKKKKKDKKKKDKKMKDGSTDDKSSKKKRKKKKKKKKKKSKADKEEKPKTEDTKVDVEMSGTTTTDGTTDAPTEAPPVPLPPDETATTSTTTETKPVEESATSSSDEEEDDVEDDEDESSDNEEPKDDKNQKSITAFFGKPKPSITPATAVSATNKPMVPTMKSRKRKLSETEDIHIDLTDDIPDSVPSEPVRKKRRIAPQLLQCSPMDATMPQASALRVFMPNIAPAQPVPNGISMGVHSAPFQSPPPMPQAKPSSMVIDLVSPSSESSMKEKTRLSTELVTESSTAEDNDTTMTDA